MSLHHPPTIKQLALRFCAFRKNLTGDTTSAASTAEKIHEAERLSNQETTMTTKTAKKATAKKVAKTKNVRAKAGSRKGAATTNARKAVEVTGRKAEVIAMMKLPGGVTTEQIQAATGMKLHSARALISGIGLIETVTKSKDGSNPTVYSIKPKE